MIVSLLYQLTRRLLSAPAVLLRRDTTKDAELLYSGTRTPSSAARSPVRSATSQQHRHHRHRMPRMSAIIERLIRTCRVGGWLNDGGQPSNRAAHSGYICRGRIMQAA
mgnify:CR=1 FL=1